MKKTIALLLALSALTFAFTSCGGNGDGKLNDISVDLNFTGIAEAKVYDTISYFMANPKDYDGKTVAITAFSSVNYCFSTNKVTSHIMLSPDPTNCCDAYYEIVSPDGKYPEIGSKTTFIGKFEDGHVSVSEMRAEETTPCEIDALAMTQTELYDFMTNYEKNYLSSDDKGKTIRICGHLSESRGYYYVCGLDQNGKTLWYIEATNPSGLSLPLQSGNYLNPVGITGTLGYYREDDRYYPCIEITSVCKISAIL